MMNKVLVIFFIVCLAIFTANNYIYASNNAKIAQAKEFILNFVSHPNTVKFHDDSIVVNKDIVTIAITYTNGLGVTQNMTMNVKVEDK